MNAAFPRMHESGSRVSAIKRVAGFSLLFFATLVTASAHPVVAGFERFHLADTKAEGGLLLLNELNCVACHAAPDTWRERLPGRGKVSLVGVGERWRDGLAAFIAHPQETKPGTLMPQFGSANGADVAAYLVLLQADSPPKHYPAGNPARGKKLFQTIGCAACHGPENGSAAVPIGLARHYGAEALAAFLQNPLYTRPAGRMPATELTDAEAADLTAHLRVGAASSVTAMPVSDALKGRSQFAALNCAACHETGDGAQARSAKALIELRDGQGCLAAEPLATVPQFSLSEPQRKALTDALRAVRGAPPSVLTAQQRVDQEFEQLNCYACHEWRGKGGAGDRSKLFTADASAVDSLGELGYLPPKLDAAGRKLTPAWLAKLLWGSGGGVRPYLHTRMPRFGQAAAGDLVPLLAEACRPEHPREMDTSGSKGHQRFFTGRTLLGINTGGLSCVACHGVKGSEPSGVRAINLTHTAQRLNPEYFMALLLDPQATQPGTIMPPLLAGRKDPEKAVESIWTYFKELDQSEVLPEGLTSPGSFELKPDLEKRPIVFRTFLEGAGTKAIAVGFPEGLHVAFDAYEVHWALIWRGRYLDAMTNWEERPMKPIKPLGEQKRMLPNHVPFAQLANSNGSWPTAFGRYAGYSFKGYRLAPNGTPTFRYTVGGLEVEDTLQPLADGQTFKRTVRVRKGASTEATGWYFRGVTTEATPQPVQWTNHQASFEETLSL